MKLAVIGAGWAGLAAAVAACRAGHDVTVLEAARTLGGRARALELTLPDGRVVQLDNGQHILAGAYGATLGLMRQVGVDPAQALLRLPLTLRFPDGRGLALPDWPAPLDAAWGILRARGWSMADKLSLLRASARWRRAGFQCPASTTVAELCADLGARVRAELIDPLCVSALNTPPERSSGQVFLRVMGDALFSRGHGGWGGSNLLLPRVDLGALFPQAAAAWLAARGARVATGQRVEQLRRAPCGWLLDGAPFDGVIVATPAWEAARLLADCGAPVQPWVRDAQALRHEAIATVYAWGDQRLPLPMLALRSGADAPAQFVFDRAQLGGPEGLLAFVVSACEGDRQSLQDRVMAQAHALGWRGLRPLQTVVEKRATFACTPALARPAVAVAPALAACGDYVEGPYPATLEGAVRAGLAAAARVTA